MPRSGKIKDMPVASRISVEEYLGTNYRPDCDYVDGEVLARNAGERKHGSTQREILYYLRDHYPHLRRQLLPEQRLQVKPTRYRVPDVCVLRDDAPIEEVVTVAPMLCVEVLSPEDTMKRVMERIKEYFQMGVPTCWIIDPISHEGWIATPGRLDDVPDGILRAGGLEMPLAEVLLE